MNKLNKGFTLIEILAVIIILGIVVLIAIPVTSNVISSSRENAYKEQVERLINLSGQYSLTNELGYTAGYVGGITYENLIDAGLLSEVPKDPRDGEKMDGCITYEWKEDVKQYNFNIAEDCSSIKPAGIPTIVPKYPSVDIAKNKVENPIVHFDVSFDSKGGATSCDIIDLSTLEEGVHTITCTALGNNGLSSQASIDVNIFLNMLVSGSTFNSKIKSLANYSNAKSIVFEEGISDIYSSISSNNKISVALLNDESIVAYVDGEVIRVQSDSEILSNIDSSSMFSGIGNIETIIFNGLNTEKTTDMSHLFATSFISTALDLSGLDTASVENMSNMFFASGNMEPINLDLSMWNTSSATNMQGMFSYTSNYGNLNLSGWDTSNVSIMHQMFSDATGLLTIQGISDFNTSKVNNFGSMFSHATELTNLDLSSWNMVRASEIIGMFSRATSLTSVGDISNWQMPNLTSTSSMFSETYNLINLDISNWNIPSVTDFSHMFSGAFRLTTLDISNWNITNGVSMSSTFFAADGIKTIYVKDQATKDILDSKKSEMNLTSGASIVIK